MSETLYDKIGRARLQQLLNDFYDRVFSNEILALLFQSSERSVIQHKQLLFISQFLGGPLDYNENYGPPKMRQRHLAHKITPKAKDEWLKCMQEAVLMQDWDDRLKEVFYNIFPPIAAHMVNSDDEI
jgi:hemoglobin